ncbi:hypothetical protein Acr_19g0002800 [Actinidia rufa]|uniref:Uncharacterized protein n=1 Tax=Actinidia rufa TaxID=165716 RepID=A0A7J0G989_9ERIC|nr:hypothetical protein Acr_19g0002800 [Actinidia rufa]
MTADVSSVVGIINGGYNDDQQAMNKESRGVVGGKSTVLITRDLLGGCYALDSKELDLDLQVPTGWEKRLDLKSGKVYLQRCDSPNAASLSSDHKQQSNGVVSKLQDLNFPPSVQQTTVNPLRGKQLRPETCFITIQLPKCVHSR